MGFDKGGVFYLALSLVAILIASIFLFSSNIVIAQEENASPDEEETGEITTELEVDAGITPDSIFYFVDEFFDRFGSSLENREEKISEIKQMIGEGKIEDARTSLERYREFADSLEKEVSPDEKQEAERSSRAIRNAVKELENEIPEDERNDFVGDIIEKEKRIETAAKIAGKIKDLCVQLAKLDPLQYSKVCKTEEETPKWHKDLDKELTEEQKKAARKFANVMKECFKTQGRQCNCNELEDINRPFADRCSVVAPLAASCNEGDEEACEAMDDATEGIEDLLPDYLLDVFEELNRDVMNDQFEFHMPIECKEKGATNPRECMKIMIEINAPDECKEELIKRDIGDEREARQICEEIMFREHAPPECIEAGIRDPKECGKFMFGKHAPDECKEAGLTGDSPKDMRECERIMKEKGFDRGRGRPEYAVAAGFRCKEIQNPEERLKCFDEALTRAGGPDEGRGPNSGWPPPCQEVRAFTRESCEKVMRAWGEQQRNNYQDYYKSGSESRFGETLERERACVERCSSEGKAWDFSNGVCSCHSGPDSYQRPPEERYPYPAPTPGFECGEGQVKRCEGDKCYCMSGEQPPAPTQPAEESTTTSATTESSTTGGITTITSEGRVTGSVIAIDNEFLDYFFKRG